MDQNCQKREIFSEFLSNFRKKFDFLLLKKFEYFFKKFQHFFGPYFRGVGGHLNWIFNEKYLEKLEKYLEVRGGGSFGRISKSTLVLFDLV